ncbi:DUF402 domain-containing protein [Rhodococcus aerolatus]
MALHPPKHETFDVGASTNVDPKGTTRPVDTYRETAWGLYLSRPADHESFHHLESWLLPGLGLRVTVFHFTAGHERDQDFYVDLGEYTRPATPGGAWTGVDHYVDLVVRTGRGTEVLDVDELVEAHAAGLLGTGDTRRAIERTAVAVDGIASHGHDLTAWLAGLGHQLSWR